MTLRNLCPESQPLHGLAITASLLVMPFLFLHILAEVKPAVAPVACCVVSLSDILIAHRI